MKQVKNIRQNNVKIPNWQEADQLDILELAQGVGLRFTEKQLQLDVRIGLKSGTLGSQVCYPNHSDRPPFTCNFSLTLQSKCTYAMQKAAIIHCNIISS